MVARRLLRLLDGDFPIFDAFSLLPRAAFAPVHIRAVRAAEIAQARRGRVDLEDKVVTGDLRIVRDARVTVRHASEDEGIVLGEGEDFPGVLALADLEVDFGAYGIGVALLSSGLQYPAMLGSGGIVDFITGHSVLRV